MTFAVGNRVYRRALRLSHAVTVPEKINYQLQSFDSLQEIQYRQGVAFLIFTMAKK